LQFDREANSLHHTTNKQFAQAIAEWEDIRKVSRDSDLAAGAKKWLAKYGLIPQSGEVINAIIGLSAWEGDPIPSVRIIQRAKSWLIKFPNEDESLRILANILRAEPSAAYLKQASVYLRQSKQMYFEASDPTSILRRSTAALITQILVRHPHSSQFAIIERLVNLYPANSVWQSVFPLYTYTSPDGPAERLTARWLRLNINNPTLDIMAVPLLVPSPEVLNLSFDWTRNAGRSHPFMPRILYHLLYSARPDKSLLRRVANFTRQWLNQNANQSFAGKLYGKLAESTESPSDIRKAIEWYKSHPENDTGGFVIVHLLERTDRTGSRPDPFLVDEAKIRLRDRETRKSFRRLLAVLVSVYSDDETVVWAKEAISTRNDQSMLVKLLRTSPDEETVEMAHRCYDSWINTSLEPEMLLSLLNVDPFDRRIRRRASYWVKHHRTDDCAGCIRTLLAIA
jgi:hypothetical protein